MSGLPGKKEGGEKTRDVLRLAVCACLGVSRGWQGLSPPGALPATLKTHAWNAMAWHPAGGSAGLGMGLERLALEGGGRKQQMSSRGGLESNLMLVDGAVSGLGLAVGFSKP